MEIIIKINMDGASFEEDGRDAEFARVFEDIRVRMVMGATRGVVNDSNGNACGRFDIVEGK